MKATIELSMVIACITCLCGCTASVSPLSAPPVAIPTASTSCPPDGSFVPFNKLMNPGFVSDYQGCNVTTTATFDATGSYMTGLENDYTIIQATPPGETFARAVALPKQGSDLVFVLKHGETILLTGGTYVGIGGKVLPVFLAKSIARAK